jgi:ArsR family transcriptional regulator
MESQKLTKIFKALSNPNRLKLYYEISKKKGAFFETGCFVYKISEKFNIGAPTISHHLKELENAELITTQRNGKQLTARINKATFEKIKEIINNI